MKAPQVTFQAPKISRPKPQSRIIGFSDPYDWRSATATASIIIISHNYAQFLGAAIESALNQTFPNVEIVVVGNAPIDDTHCVATRYADRGVRYLKTNRNNLHDARAAGFRASHGELICFLDGDDLLPPRYIESAATHFQDLSIGCVYSDSIRFAHDWKQDELKTYSRPVDEINIDNMVHCSSVVRRCCIEQARPFDYKLDMDTAEDWFMWRLIHREGWRFVKQSELFWYRWHPNQRSKRIRREKIPYYHRACLFHEPVTIFMPLSGRESCFRRQLDFLESQEWPREQIHLVALDSSGSECFRRFIRKQLECLDVARFVYDTVPAFFYPGLANKQRKGVKETQMQVQTATGFIYNRMSELCSTEYILSLEDDVIPRRPTLIEAMLRSFDQRVASVAAPYVSAYNTNAYVAWAWNGQTPLHFTKQYGDSHKGTEFVGGNGFGCTMVRRSVLKKMRMVTSGEFNLRNFDMRFYDWLRGTPWKPKVNWDLICDHMTEGRK